MLARGEDRLVGADRLAADAAVLLRQEIHREMHAAEIAAGRREIARGLRPAGQRHGVEVLNQGLAADVAPHHRAGMEDHAFCLHLLDAPLDVALLQLEIGNAVAQQAAGMRVLLEHMHCVARAGELLGAGQTGRA